MKKIIPNAFPCPPWEIHVAPEKLGPSQSNNSSGPPIWMKALQPIHFYYENKNAHPMLVFGNFNMSTFTFPMHVPRSNLCKNFAWILFIKWNECRYVIWVNLWNNFNFQVWLDKTFKTLDNNNSQVKSVGWIDDQEYLYKCSLTAQWNKEGPVLVKVNSWSHHWLLGIYCVCVLE